MFLTSNLTPASHPVLELECQRCAALVTGDWERLAAVASPRLLYVHSTGEINNLDEFLTFVRTQVRFAAAERRGVHVHATADTAWLTGLLRYEGRILASDRPLVAVSYATQLWLRGAGGWQMTHCQSTRVDEARWDTSRKTVATQGQPAGDAFECSARADGADRLR